MSDLRLGRVDGLGPRDDDLVLLVAVRLVEDEHAKLAGLQPLLGHVLDPGREVGAHHAVEAGRPQLLAVEGAAIAQEDIVVAHALPALHPLVPVVEIQFERIGQVPGAVELGPLGADRVGGPRGCPHGSSASWAPARPRCRAPCSTRPSRWCSPSRRRTCWPERGNPDPRPGWSGARSRTNPRPGAARCRGTPPPAAWPVSPPRARSACCNRPGR